MGGDPISVAMDGLRNEDRASLDRRVAATPKARRFAQTPQPLPTPPNTLWSRHIKSRASRSDALQVPLRKVGAQLRWSKGTCSAALRVAVLEPQAPKMKIIEQSVCDPATRPHIIP